MEITIEQVNKLRKATGAVMMDYKKTLVTAKGDHEEVILILKDISFGTTYSKYTKRTRRR